MHISIDMDTIKAFLLANEALAAPFVFLLATGESLALFSLFLPATMILLIVSGVIGSSGIDIWPVWLAAGLGASFGYALSYAIGWRFKDSLERTWPFRNYPDVLVASRRFFETWGLAAVFFGHFFGPGRAFIPVIAGMLTVPWLPFQLANISSAFLWATLVTAPSQIAALIAAIS